MNYLEAIILAIIQGITEFLPISSTGHMIIAEYFLGLQKSNALSEFSRLFAVSIHFGTVLAVVIIYWKRFFTSIDIYFKLFIAFIPAAVLGFLLSDTIDKVLTNVIVVAIALILGGIILLFVDKWWNYKDEEKEPSYLSSLIIGLFQVIAMIPGVSRSGATIVGGMFQKLTRKKAAEFSFLLAVPTVLAASGYKMLKEYKSINSENINLLVIGNIVAFIIAIIAIKTFIGIIQKYGFKAFGYYRIILGSILLILLALGYNLNVGID
ncbi:MAG: undecaprenyl-diphosphate phosphatase [Bacteroidetes bacterium]|nr:undecaprenyl-diphosphate phosphatase [Bacteroidota bacterium]